MRSSRLAPRRDATYRAHRHPLLAIIVEWLAGSEFVGHMTNGTSLTMALATAVAILCYALVIFSRRKPTPIIVKLKRATERCARAAALGHEPRAPTTKGHRP